MAGILNNIIMTVILLFYKPQLARNGCKFFEEWPKKLIGGMKLGLKSLQSKNERECSHKLVL